MTDDTKAEKSPNQVTIYSPNRIARRRIAGSPCGFCGLRMHMTEIVAVQQPGFPPDYTHPSCLEMNLEQPDAERERSAPSANKDGSTDET